MVPGSAPLISDVLLHLGPGEVEAKVYIEHAGLRRLTFCRGVGKGADLGGRTPFAEKERAAGTLQNARATKTRMIKKV